MEGRDVIILSGGILKGKIKDSVVVCLVFCAGVIF